jgi:hypothetical protein
MSWWWEHVEEEDAHFMAARKQRHRVREEETGDK